VVSRGPAMTSATVSYPRDEFAELTSVMRLLAEAPDRRAFFATLREALPRLLPATRIDIFMNEPRNSSHQLLTSGATASAAQATTRTTTGFAQWLSSQGYSAIATLPLNGAGQQLGWLLLARRHDPFEPDTLALAGQLAALISLRLLYEQRDDMARRDTASSLLEQHLQDVEALRQRAILAAGAAHDIRNLLMIIVGYASLMEHNSPAVLQPDLQAIVRAANDGQQLIRRLLAAQMPKPAGPMPITLLPTVIRDAIKLTQPFWEARADIIVKTMLWPVPPTCGNAVELREVLINLIINALAAMPVGGTLTVRSFASGQRVLVAVADTGEGIAHERQHEIFQPFVALHAESSGLGLSVSRAIIESYGGTLTVESSPGAGATFTLALPAVRSLAMLSDDR
jgi:signal transduction histidine kinase